MPVGGPCCARIEDSHDKVFIPMHNVLFGHGWSIAAESRWVHILRLLLRIFIASVGTGMLPQLLVALQLFWRVEESMAAQLARLVAADKDDYSARRKLRLLRVVQNLGPTAVRSSVSPFI